MIDNSLNVYIPFRLKCGITAQCRLEVFDTFPEILDVIEEDVFNCIRALPPSVHDLVRRTNVWINVSYVYGPLDRPKELKHTTTHHYERWLICVNDIPDKALGIEIYNCNEYLRNRDHWNGCGLLLHEFCHLIHQIILPQGLENKYVKVMYDIAMESGKYEEVIRRDWAYLPCNRDTAYATINHKEFFTELSVAFLSYGYQHLDVAQDSKSMSMYVLSPPFQAPDVLDRQKGQNPMNHEKNSKPFLHVLFQLMKNSIWINSQGHCNKFYPFTNRQLKSFDYDTYVRMTEIWDEIKNWKDPLATEPCWKIAVCWNRQDAGNDMEEKLISNTDIFDIAHFPPRTEDIIPDSVEL